MIGNMIKTKFGYDFIDRGIMIPREDRNNKLLKKIQY